MVLENYPNFKKWTFYAIVIWIFSIIAYSFCIGNVSGWGQLGCTYFLFPTIPILIDIEVSLPLELINLIVLILLGGLIGFIKDKRSLSKN